MIKIKFSFTFGVAITFFCLLVGSLAAPVVLAGGGGGGGSSSGGSSSSGGGTLQAGTYGVDGRSQANVISRDLNRNPSQMPGGHSAVVTSNRDGTVSVSIRPNDSGGGGSSSSGNPTPGGPRVSPVTGSRPATGYFDSAISSSCRVTGWAYDPDNAAAVIAVHVYQDGPAGRGRFVTSCQANQSRPDVNSIIRIPGNHGFNCALPASFVNTGSHALFIHAIDINGAPNNLLRTNGKTINCGGVNTAPSGPSGPSGPGPTAGNPTPVTPGTISVTAQSAVVRKFNTTNVRWQISNPIPVGYTCTLNGPGLVNIPITTQSGSRPTQPINSTSIFTVSCTNGTAPVSGEATIEIIPQVQEV